MGDSSIPIDPIRMDQESRQSRQRSASKVVTGLRRANFAVFNHPQLSTVTACLKPPDVRNRPLG